MYGMVFAAGLGTRLRPLTERLPKPVVPVLDRPLASYSLERLAAAGVRVCAVNTHHLAEEVPRALNGHVPAGMEVRYVHEPRILGTGGGLRSGLTAVGAAGASEPILVMNGDILFWPDLEGALALHRRLGAVATMVLRPDPRARALGSIEIDARGRVRRLLGEPADPAGEPLGEHMFTGVHVLDPTAIAELPTEGCVIRRAYRLWIDSGAIVGGFVDRADWRDLGTPADYHAAQMGLLRGSLTWPGAELPHGELRGEGAVVGEGATLSSVVLGRRSRVAPGVILRRAVVWPDTVVAEDLEDVICAPHATVRIGATSPDGARQGPHVETEP